MFTGIVKETGTVRRLTRRGSMAMVEVAASETPGQLSIGDSVAVAGACLTVTEAREGWFAAQLSGETLASTTLGAAQPGQPVNLEPALQLSDRLGGHLVTGHVDGVGAITRRVSKDETITLACRAPSEVAPYLLRKGSVSMDGVSLTVVGVEGAEFTVTMIARTAGETTLGSLEVGDKVNLEADLIGKYVERFVQGGGGLTEGRLRELGF